MAPEAEVPTVTAAEAEAALAEAAASGGLPPGKAAPDLALIEASDPAAAIKEFATSDPVRTAQVLRRWIAMGQEDE